MKTSFSPNQIRRASTSDIVTYSDNVVLDRKQNKKNQVEYSRLVINRNLTDRQTDK